MFNFRKIGINIWLSIESLALIAILVLALISGVTGVVKDNTGDSEDNKVSVNTGNDTNEENNKDNDWFNSESEDDSEGEDESGSEVADSKWSIPEDYAEDRITFSDTIEAKLAAMTMEQKVAQLFIVTPEALTGYQQVTVFGNASKQAFTQQPVGGLIYGANNYQGADQMNALLTGAKDYSTQNYGYTVFAFMNAKDATEEVRTIIDTVETSGVLDAATYFAADTGASFEELSAGSFVTYQQNIDAGAAFIVVSNAIVECITDDANVPCTLSGRTVGLLRESMGYNGVLITDDFSDAGFVSVYGNGTACVEAIKAGMDMIYMPYDFATAYDSVLEAVNNGNITEDRLNNAVGRILTAKGV